MDAADELMCILKEVGIPRAPQEDFDMITNRPLPPEDS